MRCIAWLLLASFAMPAAAETPPSVRTVEGRYLRLRSDGVEKEMEELVAAFDAAVPQWCAFMKVDQKRLDDWRVTADLMESVSAMEAAGVLQAGLPRFHRGVQRGRSIWVVRQPSRYYTRHLLLHEGVHAFMFQLYGDAGPGWYQEGMAELLATHRWDGSAIDLPVVPESREAFPYWGRFKELDRRRAAGAGLAMRSLMQYQNTATDRPEPYAWSWAMVSLSGAYPEFHEALLASTSELAQPDGDFNDAFRDSLGDWQKWRLRWRLLVDEFDYGYDLRRNALRPAARHGDDPSRFVIAADVGWQDTGIAVSAGQTITVVAEGRYTIGTAPRPWVCEPQGVTIRYHRDQPIGRLLATVASGGVVGSVVRPLVIEPVGRKGTFNAAESGRLLLRIGDDPAELADNAGNATVTVTLPSG